MRRTDRQVTDPAKIRAMVARCQVLRLAMTDGRRPYVVPVNFGFREESGQWEFYFHSAREGKKLEILRQNPQVCLELDGGHRLVSGGEVACKYGYGYESIIAQGEARELTDPAQAAGALELLMGHQTGRDFPVTADQARTVSVWCIRVTELSAKARRPPAAEA